MKDIKLITVYIPIKAKSKSVKTTITSIPKEDWGVHETHCCLEHGCKYSYKDCPVAIGLTKQEYDCEYCGEDFYPEMTKSESVVFGKEEFNIFLEEYGKKLLEKAAENAKIKYSPFGDMDAEGVDKQSITEVLPEVIKKYQL